MRGKPNDVKNDYRYSELREEQGNKTRIRRSEYDQFIPVVGIDSKEEEEIERLAVYVN